tara:strand:+ start:23206 stop:23571 length:366 start_codon:yes stop_codon:yes gene_type:complete
MSYFPNTFDHDINTTETATDEIIEDRLVYRVLVKHSGAMTASATTSVAHGVTFDKLIRITMTIERDDGTTISFPWNHQNSGSTLHLGCTVDGTNVDIHLGAGWTGANNLLTDAWIIMEYLK